MSGLEPDCGKAITMNVSKQYAKTNDKESLNVSRSNKQIEFRQSEFFRR